MRYLAVLLRSLGATLAAEMVYREDFLVALFTAALETLGRVVALFAMVRAGVGLGGWRLEEALLVVGAAVFLLGLHVGLVIPNLTAFSRRVLLGSLDFVLLRPLDAQFLLMFERVSLWGLPDLLAGAGLVLYAARALGLEGGRVLAFFLLLFLAGLLFYLLAFLVSLLAIWVVYVHNLINFLANFLRAGQYPAGAYGPGLRLFFTLVVPVYWMTTVPAEVALGRVGWGAVLGLFAWVLVAFGLGRGLFRLALRHYGSASS